MKTSPFSSVHVHVDMTEKSLRYIEREREREKNAYDQNEQHNDCLLV